MILTEVGTCAGTFENRVRWNIWPSSFTWLSCPSGWRCDGLEGEEVSADDRKQIIYGAKLSHTRLHLVVI